MEDLKINDIIETSIELPLVKVTSDRSNLAFNEKKDEFTEETIFRRKREVKKYTLALFLSRAKEVWGDKYDLSLVTEDQIKNGNKSKVTIRCYDGHIFRPTIGNFLNLKRGCPACSGHLPYTLALFLSKAKEVWGDKYDLSLVTEDQIKGVKSKVTIRCSDGHIFRPTIGNFLSQKTGCPACAGKLPYTLALFLSKAKEVWGDKYDLSLVTENQIKGAKSKVTIRCSDGHIFTPTINSFLNKKSGCSACSGHLPYTLALFLSKAKEVWGDKYDLSLVTENQIKSVKSRVTIRCLKGHIFTPTINNFLNNKTGCSACSGKLPYTLDLFLSKAKEVWGDKYDLSLVTENQIKGAHSKVTIRCSNGHIFTPTISSFLNKKSGCSACSGLLPYTLDLFLSKAKEVWGDKYDLSLVTEDQIKGGHKSRVTIRCLKGHIFRPTISSFLSQKTGCPACAGKLPYTLALFLSKAKEVWGDKYDLSLVTENQIKGAKSKVTIRCSDGHIFTPTINSFISQKSGCSACSGHLPYTLDLFLSKAKEVWGDKYDLSLVTENQIKSVKSRVTIKCPDGHIFTPTINNFLNQKSGCPTCASSKGEEICSQTLRDFKIDFTTEFKIKERLGRKAFDFMFEIDMQKYLLEFDGEQHFTMNKFFHKNEEKIFLKRQADDKLKQSIALEEGFFLIRIDYLILEDKIPLLISEAINILSKEDPVFYSTPEMYRYLED